MKTSLSRRIVVLVAAAGLMLSGIAVPAAHAAKGGNRSPGTEEATTKGKGRSQNEHQRGKSEAAKQRKAVRFTAKGVVTANDGTTLTLDPARGTKNVRNLDALSVTLAEGAKVIVDDVVVELSAVLVGDRVLVKGQLSAAEAADGTAKKVIGQGQPGTDADEDATTDPADDGTTATDPVTTDPVTTDPVTTDPVTTDPVDDGTTTEPGV